MFVRGHKKFEVFGKVFQNMMKGDVTDFRELIFNDENKSLIAKLNLPNVISDETV